MLGIWHGVEWLKRDLDQPFYGQVGHGSPIPRLDNERLFFLVFL